MNNFLASFDMKALFAHTVMLLLIDLSLFSIILYYCFTVVQLSLYELLPPELHLSIRVERHSHTHIHSTTALCMPETQYCNRTAIPT